MFDFEKKRLEAEQQRKFDQVLRAQEEILALYEPTRPATLQDVKASFERGLRDDRG